MLVRVGWRSVHPHLSHSAPPTAIDRPRNPGAVSRGRVSTLVSLLRASLLVLAGFRREQVYWTGKRWRAMLWASRWWLSALGGPPGRCARAPRPIAAPPFGAAERGGQRCGARSAQVAHSRHKLACACAAWAGGASASGAPPSPVIVRQQLNLAARPHNSPRPRRRSAALCATCALPVASSEARRARAFPRTRTAGVASR